MGHNMTNRLSRVISWVSPLTFSSICVHSDTDHVPINPFSLIYYIPRMRRLMNISKRHSAFSEYICSVYL